MFSAPQTCCALGVRPALHVLQAARFQVLLLEGALLHQEESQGVLEMALLALCHPRTGTGATSVSMVLFSGVFFSPRGIGVHCAFAHCRYKERKAGIWLCELTAHGEALMGLDSFLARAR